MYDVRFHGPFVLLPQQVREAHYRVAQPAAPGAAGRWGAQYPSLWVTRGGGGTFASVWSPNTFARSGFYVSDTTDAGLRLRTVVRAPSRARDQAGRVANWEFHAPQTEEESATSPDAVALRDRRFHQHHVRQLQGVSRDAQPRAVSRGGADLRLVEHPLPQRARELGARLWHLRRERLRHVPARGEVPVRQRHPGHDAARRGARARLRGVRHRRRSEPPGLPHRRLRWLRQGDRGASRRRVRRDRRRRGRRCRHALLRRPPPAPDLLVVARARPLHRRRRASRPGEPGGRTVGRPARPVVGRAARARSTRCDRARHPTPSPSSSRVRWRRRPMRRSCCR